MSPPNNPAPSDSDSDDTRRHRAKRPRRSALTMGPKKKPYKPNTISQCCHFGRIIHALCNVQALVTNGLLRTAELVDRPIDSFTANERREHQAFRGLLELVPGLETRIMEGMEDDLVYICDKLQQGVSGARADDTKGLKGGILDWVMPRGVPLNPPLSRNIKTDRGYHHHRTGELLCPAELDWTDVAIQTKLRTGEILVRGDQWPVVLYSGERYDPEDPWNGLLHGELRVTAYKFVFTSPSSVDKSPRATRSGNARIHGMTRVTLPSIAYIATQVRFALTSSAVFSRTDTITDSERFYNSIIGLLDDPDEQEEVSDLLVWWNRRIFPAYSNPTVTATENSALAKIKAKRVRQRAAESAATS